MLTTFVIKDSDDIEHHFYLCGNCFSLVLFVKQLSHEIKCEGDYQE